MNGTRVRYGTAIAAALLLGACTSAPPQPESMRDPNADWASYATYGWAPAPGGTGNDQTLLLLDQDIRRAVAAELQRRGYTEATGDPDLRIAYQSASEDKAQSNPVRIGVGMGSWGSNVGGSVNVGSPGTRNYREGTLVIHAIDAARNAEVWQGRMSNRISKGSVETAAVTAAVQAAMRDFPVRQSSD